LGGGGGGWWSPLQSSTLVSPIGSLCNHLHDMKVLNTSKFNIVEEET